jgi:hypothetical protein
LPRIDDDDGLRVVGAGDLDAGVNDDRRFAPLGRFLDVRDKGAVVVVGYPNHGNTFRHARGHKAGSPVFPPLFILWRPPWQARHAHPIPIPRGVALTVSPVPDRSGMAAFCVRHWRIAAGKSNKGTTGGGLNGRAQAQLLVEDFAKVVRCGPNEEMEENFRRILVR